MAIAAFIIIIITLLLSIFTPTLYTVDWEFGKITGIGKVYNEGNKTSYDLFSLYGGMYILFVVIMIAAIVLLIILYKKKMLNFYIIIPFMFLWCVPTLFLLLGRKLLKEEGQFIGNSIGSYGTGTSAALTSSGYFIIFLTILAISLLVFYEFFQVKKDVNHSNYTKTKKKIEVKKEKDIKIDNFKM